MTEAEGSEVAVRGPSGLGNFSTESLLEGTDAKAKGEATAEDAREAMGNRKPSLERIEVKHGGVCEYHLPDGTKVAGADGFIGVITGFTFHNSRFGKPYEEFEVGDQPPCYSNDGTNVAEQAEAPESAKGCAFCPWNRDATDQDARDKAFDLDSKSGEVCGNYLSLAVLLPGNEMPYVLRLSNQSFKPWAVYVQRLLTRFRAQPYEVATHFRLKNVKKKNAEFSVLDVDVAKNSKEEQGLLPEALRKSLKVQATNYTGLLRREAVISSDPSGEPTDEARRSTRKAKEKAKSAAGGEAGL